MESPENNLTQVEQKQHSLLGIATLILSLAAPLLLLGIPLALMTIRAANVEASLLEPFIWVFFLIFGWFLGLLAALIALGLGIAGLRQKKRKKTLALTGTLLAILELCVIVPSILLTLHF